MNDINILITEDHEMYLEGLEMLLNKQEGFLVKKTFSNGKDLLSHLPDHNAQLLLLDVHLPDMDPEALLKQIRTIQPDIPILYLTMMRGTRNVHKLIRHRITGYILKNAPVAELCAAIRSVADGGSYFSKEIDISDGNGDFRQTVTVAEGKIDEILTKREIEVLKMVCKEFSNSEIAEKLFLSVGTVETHRKNIIAKLGVNNTVGLVKYALRNKLID